MYSVILKVNVKIGPHMVCAFVLNTYFAELYFLLLNVGARYGLFLQFFEICGSRTCLYCCSVTVKHALTLSMLIKTERPELLVHGLAVVFF